VACVKTTLGSPVSGTAAGCSVILGLFTRTLLLFQRGGQVGNAWRRRQHQRRPLPVTFPHIYKHMGCADTRPSLSSLISDHCQQRAETGRSTFQTHLFGL
jgi:hypothetical protein